MELSHTASAAAAAAEACQFVAGASRRLVVVWQIKHRRSDSA